MKTPDPASILIIDDDPSVVYTLISMFTPMGHQVMSSENLAGGRKALTTHTFDIVFLDVHLPDGSGLDFLSEIQKSADPPLTIVMTGFADPEGAERAVLNGAWDYLEKPLSGRKITLQMIRALQYRKKKHPARDAVLLNRQEIIGDSPAIRQSLGIAAKAANCDAPVLIQGETGTGKELFARAIHENSNRSNENFMVVDCGIMTETLVESLLFGHVKGAFTGANRDQTGIIRMADRGTLFLDEIGDLPLQTQTSFLRVLQEKRFRPVGARKEIASDFRVIAATNKNLEQMARENRFRTDLLYRLRSINLELPPLRTRPEDIKPLALHYITFFCDRYGIAAKGYSPDFIEAMEAYDWPGNARELIHALDSAIAMAHNDPTLFPLHLPKSIRVFLARHSLTNPNPAKPDNSPPPEPALDTVRIPTLKSVIEKTEKDYFQHLLSATHGDIRQICDISGLSRAMVYARFKKFNLSRDSARKQR